MCACLSARMDPTNSNTNCIHSAHHTTPGPCAMLLAQLKLEQRLAAQQSAGQPVNSTALADSPLCSPAAGGLHCCHALVC